MNLSHSLAVAVVGRCGGDAELWDVPSSALLVAGCGGSGGLWLCSAGAVSCSWLLVQEGREQRDHSCLLPEKAPGCLLSCSGAGGDSQVPVVQ